MKRFVLFLIFGLTIASCGGNSGKNSNKTLDPDTFLELLTRDDFTMVSSNIYLHDYGYQPAATLQLDGGITNRIFIKDCDYSDEYKKVISWKETSEVIQAYTSDSDNSFSINQVVGNATLYNAIIESLKSKGYSETETGEDTIYLSNGSLGVTCKKDGNTWSIICTPIIDDSISADEAYDLTNNPLKLKSDYSDKRIKIKGWVESIVPSNNSSKLVYGFRRSGINLNVAVPINEGEYNIQLPRRLSISGFVSDVNQYGIIELYDVEIFDENDEVYLVTRGNHSTSDNDQTRFTGYLTNGSKKYNIEMVINVFNGYEIEGYYRYLSQPEDKRIPLKGYIEQSTGAFTYIQRLQLFSGEGTEYFSITLNDDWTKGDGDWYKYSTAEDCEKAGDNYTSRLQLFLRSE